MYEYEYECRVLVDRGRVEEGVRKYEVRVLFRSDQVRSKVW